jgi:hypothetical protein
MSQFFHPSLTKANERAKKERLKNIKNCFRLWKLDKNVREHGRNGLRKIGWRAEKPPQSMGNMANNHHVLYLCFMTKFYTQSLNLKFYCPLNFKHHKIHFAYFLTA